MKEYYFEGSMIKFFHKDSSRYIKYRGRYSSLWAKNPSIRLPFRVEKYYRPKIFYNGIVNRNKDMEYGYYRVLRGIGRNILAKYLKEVTSNDVMLKENY